MRTRRANKVSLIAMAKLPEPGAVEPEPEKHLKLVPRPSGVVAMERAMQFAWDIGADMKHEHGWKAYAARRMGLNYSTAWSLINGHTPALSTKTVDRIALKTGVPVSSLYDPEFE